MIKASVELQAQESEETVEVFYTWPVMFMKQVPLEDRTNMVRPEVPARDKEEPAEVFYTWPVSFMKQVLPEDRLNEVAGAQPLEEIESAFTKIQACNQPLRAYSATKSSIRHGTAPSL